MLVWSPSVWLQGLYSSNRRMISQGENPLDLDVTYPWAVCSACLGWGFLGEGFGKAEKSPVPQVCEMCVSGDGEGGRPQEQGTLAESVRQVDPADGHGDAFTSALCSLPILNTKFPQGMLPLFWGPLRWSLSWGMQDGVGVLTGAGVGTWAVASSKT